MDWRFWKRRRRTAVEEESPATGETPAAPPAPAGDAAADDAPRFEPFSFEATTTEAPVDGSAGAPPDGPTDSTDLPVEHIREAVRRRTGRRLPADGAHRPTTGGVEPLLVPSLREQALVYRVAAEQRSADDPATAPALWRAWLELCPDDAEGWFALGRLHLAERRLAEAEQAFRRARRCAPADPLPAGALGFLAGLVGDWRAAVGHYAEAVSLAPDDGELAARLAEAEQAARAGGGASHRGGSSRHAPDDADSP